jgi:hypothetical protein
MSSAFFGSMIRSDGNTAMIFLASAKLDTLAVKQAGEGTSKIKCSHLLQKYFPQAHDRKPETRI